MNKQQLAAKIWASANQMRSKIEANEYKDYILGFIFYKYLSEAQIRFTLKEGFSQEDIRNLSEEEGETMKYIQKNVGYFIAYENLFSTWIEVGSDFGVANVHTALSAFSRLIDPVHKKLFEGIFDTLQTGLSKLGENANAQTKAISDLLYLIKDIPMDGKQDYDVLGFIYEYLISMFAATAGKKAGEFYTPHEVSQLMSDIVAHELQNRSEIQIYDPTSGSGSLLITIGKSIARYMNNANNIKYYAQELKQNTYNLTRMNLVMRGILATNIVTRNADTLESDWPYVDENHQFNPLYVDAVVSNPPYSQKWDPFGKEDDPRYQNYGLAPKSKADFAFLLHDLYHLKPKGIMTIVLPHGVLFRGGEEGTIRERLIENNNIDAVIGLPSNIFFGTGIPTVILVIKQKREGNDVLIIDASKGFEKVGKNNKLRTSDIKRIVDTYVERKDVPNYAKVVSKQDLRDNEYNLNIPRYVDSSEKAESFDIYATMFGGIPQQEIEELKVYWEAFPTLRNQLFETVSPEMAQLKADDITTTIQSNTEVQTFNKKYYDALSSFPLHLKTRLIDGLENVSIGKEEAALSTEIFDRINQIPLIDKYAAFQMLSNQWETIAGDIEILQTEGVQAAKVVDPNLVIKKKNNKEVEVQEGWKGHIFPFKLVQEVYLQEQVQALATLQNQAVELTSEVDELFESLSDETKDSDLTNEAKDKLVAGELTKAVKEITADIKKGIVYREDDDETKLVRISKLQSELKTINKKVTDQTAALHLQTKQLIESLLDDQVTNLLEQKWITPLVINLNEIPTNKLDELSQKINHLATKYETTLIEVNEQLKESQTALATMMDELTGSNHDLEAIKTLQNLLNIE
ncbi:type I restriction-modification system subunit M [Myroides odoratimimus]|uniref:type I restriction-modification system subunit M n=1 Tax=Myroides odoratimimus TaxID=76832 RepID=UPI00257522C9|nr:type I restriction-modification system subunit M [Myroides odoratimimus]MDM1412447.1 type I restriction-modification system subunit M [Myroides odoratimimus]MEC4007708.1 type I restriction-modification system subunit M [Myroides odoratimimus]MEC4084637.1 type I restriction-modification system subunit M [Myroides odoratimimus]